MNRFAYFLKNSKSFNYFLIFIFCLLLTLFLRIYNLEDVYTEYDDVGVLALHEFNTEDQNIKLNISNLKYNFTIKKDKINQFENSFLFPFYIAYSWTYAPGQYFFYPLINNNEDNYNEKIYKGRILSVTASTICFLLLFLLFHKISSNKLSFLTFFCVLFYSLSSNSILYSHHMGPYSTYSMASAISLYLLCLQFKKKININSFFLLNTFLLYFSYLNILFYLPSIIIFLNKHNFLEIFKKFFTRPILTLINIILFFPIILLIFHKKKYGFGKRGISIQDYQNDASFFDYFLININQIFISFRSVFYGFINFSNIFILLFFLFFLIIFYIFKFKKLSLPKKNIINFEINNIFLICCFSFFIQWIILFNFSVLPLDQTRHSLAFFPVAITICFTILNYFKIRNIFYLLLIISLLPLSISENIRLIDSKKSNFKFEIFNAYSTKNIITYEQTLSPALFFNNSHSVYNISFNSFKQIIDNDNIKDFLFVSQSKSLNQFMNLLSQDHDSKRFKHKTSILKFLNKYHHIIVNEDSSEIYFPYNNYTVNSNPNGFYLYYFKKKK